MPKIYTSILEVFLDGYVQGKQGASFQTTLSDVKLKANVFSVNGIHSPGVRGVSPIKFSAEITDEMGSFKIAKYKVL